MQYLGPHPDLLHQHEHLHKTPGGSLRTVKLGLQATRPGTQLHFLPSRSHPLSLHPVSGELLTLLFSNSALMKESWYLHLCPLCREYNWPLKGMGLNCKGPFLRRFFSIGYRRLVESMDVEPWIQRKLISPRASTTEAPHPPPLQPRARALQQETPPQWEGCTSQQKVVPARRN